MTRRIVLLGATAYTGELAGRAMTERGLRPVLAGRRSEALRALADELGGLEYQVVNIEDPASVERLVQRDDVLVTTVGPFTLWGQVALNAAINVGAAYVDCNGEPGFTRQVFEQLSPQAETADSLLLPGMAYAFVPGTLAAAYALDEADPAASRLRIAYCLTGDWEWSGGSRATSAAARLEPSFTYRGGRIVDEGPARRFHRFEVDGSTQPAISFGSPEAFALPRTYSTLREVDVYVDWMTKASRPLHLLSPLTSAISRIPGVRATARAVAARSGKGSSGGPDPQTVARSGSLFIAEVLSRDGDVLNEARLEGPNSYLLTGRILAWAAEQVAVGAAEGVGALGPLEAFGFEVLQAGLTECGVTRVER